MLSAFGVTSPFNDLATSAVCWVGFLGFWLAMLNALPIPGLDGYYMFAGVLSRLFGAERAFKIARSTGLFITGLIAFMTLIQRIPSVYS
ncbi:hypothetical protein DRO58_00725 [Candidatus Bathyarchaeota archaeon]|nr:MAG: hypothetical protein DRO58_00725 [Candidatus Bathyarchaeota archaeon]